MDPIARNWFHSEKTIRAPPPLHLSGSSLRFLPVPAARIRLVSFFTRFVSRGKSGRWVPQVYEVLHLYISPNWSVADRLFYLRGWEGGTRTETRPTVRTHARISEWKPRVSGWSGAGTRNRPYIYRQRITLVEKARVLRESRSFFSPSLYDLFVS